MLTDRGIPMLIVLIRTVILYIVALFVIRIMGKGELAKLDPFQMVVLFMIAELATFPIESSDIPLFAGVVAMLALVFLQILISAISKKNQRVAELLSGRPSILISKGKINEMQISKMSSDTMRANTSNIIKVLDKHLTRKR